MTAIAHRTHDTAGKDTADRRAFTDRGGWANYPKNIAEEKPTD